MRFPSVPNLATLSRAVAQVATTLILGIRSGYRLTKLSRLGYKRDAPAKGGPVHEKRWQSEESFTPSNEYRLVDAQ
jgi:hypothetical protein